MISKKIFYLSMALCAVSAVRAAEVAAELEFDRPVRVSVCDRVSNAMRETYAAGRNKVGQAVNAVNNNLVSAKTTVINAGVAAKQATQNRINAVQANYAQYKNQVRSAVALQMNQAGRVAAQKLNEAQFLYAVSKPVVEAQARRALDKTTEVTNKFMKTRLGGSVKRKVGALQDSVNYWLEEDDYDKSWATKNPKKTAGLIVTSAILAAMVYGHQQLDLVNRFKTAKRAVWQKFGWENKPETKIA